MAAASDAHVHVIAGPLGTGRSRAAGELARLADAPVVVADRTQCYLDLAVSTARGRADAVTRYHLAGLHVADGPFRAAAAASALIGRLTTLTKTHSLVLVEGGSLGLMRHLAEHRAEWPFRLTAHVLGIADPRAHALHLRARALRLLDTGMLEEFAAAWRHTAQRPFLRSINGLGALATWCDDMALTPAELLSLPRDPALLLELADHVGRAHLARATVQSAVFTALFGADRAADRRG